MNEVPLDRVALEADATLLDVLSCIDKSGLHAAMLVDHESRLTGLLTDGDVRRAILAGASLDDAAAPHATTSPQTVRAGTGRAAVLDLMRALHLSVVPVVRDHRVVGLHTLNEVAGRAPLPNPVVVMAGGRGTRLGALTQNTPKPLLKVAGRSIVEWILLNLVGDGIEHVYVSVNHLAEQVEDHLGDGSRLGCRIEYLREDPDRPLGTGGSLNLLRRARPDLHDDVVVMNGDLMVQFDVVALLAAHAEHDAALTVATRAYQHEVRFGVVEESEPGRVSGITEKPTLSLSVNAGVYAVAATTLDLVPADTAYTMPALLQQCLSRGLPVASWPLSSEWIDVGTRADLARAESGT